MTREDFWHIRGGPKNGGFFGRMSGHRFVIGRNHRPMTRNARERFFRQSMDRKRREGWAR